MYQVNISEKVDGTSTAWISEWSGSSYVGVTTDTVYADGADTTDWCVFCGTKEECQSYINSL